MLPFLFHIAEVIENDLKFHLPIFLELANGLAVVITKSSGFSRQITIVTCQEYHITLLLSLRDIVYRLRVCSARHAICRETIDGRINMKNSSHFCTIYWNNSALHHQ